MRKNAKKLTVDTSENIATVSDTLPSIPTVYTYNGQIGFWSMTGAITLSLVLVNIIFAVPALILLGYVASHVR